MPARRGIFRFSLCAGCLISTPSDPGLLLCDARGLAPPLHSPRAGAPPCTQGFLRGRQSLHPPAGAPPCTRVTFPSRGKSPKARQGLRPLESPWCKVAALAALAYASRRAAFFYRKRPICHFEHVGKSVSFFPLVPSREHSLLSIRGTADSLPPRMLEGLSYHNQYR